MLDRTYGEGGDGDGKDSIGCRTSSTLPSIFRTFNMAYILAIKVVSDDGRES
jgi:hypothetical protein